MSWGYMGTPPPEARRRMDLAHRLKTTYEIASGLSAALVLQKTLGEHRFISPELEASLGDWRERHENNIRLSGERIGSYDYDDYPGKYDVGEDLVVAAEECVQEALGILPGS